ncbi:hypothetical protein NIASO_20320 [Niabella soli DSM 19437]|uniref:Uncharacterized protein n=1 Tax=Niabella soli DSM 19437 TaxID=929713 RepID=W0F9D6_9BACT|nr:hypothetical protein NIASO_20320 [Niabella soli DSM 19437]
MLIVWQSAATISSIDKNKTFLWPVDLRSSFVQHSSAKICGELMPSLQNRKNLSRRIPVAAALCAAVQECDATKLIEVLLPGP